MVLALYTTCVLVRIATNEIYQQIEYLAVNTPARNGFVCRVRITDAGEKLRI